MNETDKIIDLLAKINLFPGQKKMYDIVQKAHPEITRQQIQHYFDTDTTTQLTKIQKKQKPTGHIVAYHVNELWQMDIFDLSRYQRDNDGYRYVLVSVDVFSRKAFVAPIKEKTPVEVKRGFEILTKGVKPRSIISDHEGSFISKEFTAYLDKLQIPLNVNAISDHHALGIIDNFARRIKTILTKMFLKSNNTKWTDDIDRIVFQYNTMSNAALDNLSPNDACKKDNFEKILNMNIDKNLHNNTVSDLAIGDKVRKNVLFQDAHSKGTDPRWSDEVFTVKAISGKSILLNNNIKYKRDKLLKVPPDTTSTPTNPIILAKKVNQQLKQEAKQREA